MKQIAIGLAVILNLNVIYGMELSQPNAQALKAAALTKLQANEGAPQQLPRAELLAIQHTSGLAPITGIPAKPPIEITRRFPRAIRSVPPIAPKIRKSIRQKNKKTA